MPGSLPGRNYVILAYFSGKSFEMKWIPTISNPFERDIIFLLSHKKIVVRFDNIL